MHRALPIVRLCLFFAAGAWPLAGQTNARFDLWRRPSYFRGFNAGYWSSHDPYAKQLKDMAACKKTGANLVKINIYGGFSDYRPPYRALPENRTALETMIGFCRKLDLYYVIDVRAGPGRRDVSEDNDDTLWTDKTAQERYLEMLRFLVTRYGSDRRCVGLNLIVEPNPLHRRIDDGTITSPAQLKKELARRGIDLPRLYAFFIRGIRAIDTALPLIVQNVAYSDPEWWDLMAKQTDPYIVYDVHSYVPFEYTHAAREETRRYPGTYWCLSRDTEAVFDKNLLRQAVLAPVRRFGQKYRVPILLGEFGLRFPRTGGVRFLADCAALAREEGWHFALWSFRPDNPDNGKEIEFDPEKWDSAYWKEITAWFKRR